METDIWTGKTLDKYEMGPLVGQGGMAHVYKARHPGLNRDVAIKLIHSHLANREGFLERFQREAQMVAALRHPNIVQVFDFDAYFGVYYMVMEFIDGPTLARHLEELRSRGQEFPLTQAIDLLIALCDALDYAHAQGVVHRDLKPGNVMFTSKGTPVLTDFGLAKIVGAATLTLSGMVVGTPMYMSPEQGHGQPGDGRSDIYALGVILYELVTGHPPFEGDTPLSIILKQVSQPLPSARLVNPRVPEAVEQIINRATAKQPAERYQTCGEFAADLRALELSAPRRENQRVNTPPPSLPLVPAVDRYPTPPSRKVISLDSLPGLFVQVLGPVGRIMEVDRAVKAMGEKREAFPADRLDELLDRVAVQYRVSDQEKRTQIRERAHELFEGPVEKPAKATSSKVSRFPSLLRSGNRAVVSESFFDRMSRELFALVGPAGMQNFDLSQQIAALGETREAFPRDKMRQLIQAVSAALPDGRVRAEFERRMSAASKEL